MKQLLSILFALLLWPVMSYGQLVTPQSQPSAETTTAAQPQEVKAEVKDSVVISVLTCTPGSLVYELYGHTAIRVRELGLHESDWVFNYGTFTFQQPHFMWRFVLGETDYELSVVPYNLFYEAYVREGRGIDEQVLRLTSAEAASVRDALAENLDPKNSVYRYNFFYDNCTTRAIDKVTAPVKNHLKWGGVDTTKTLRDIVHEFSAISPWNRFGQDLLLGAEADQPADLAKQEFAPVYAEHFLDQAQLTIDGKVVPFVKANLTLLPAQAETEKPFFITPMWAFGILLAFTIVLIAIEEKRGKYYWQYDMVLMLAQGLVGCIITFLFFFSSHPAVGSNYLIILFNPLPLIGFAWYIKAASQRKYSPLSNGEIVLSLTTLGVAASGVQKFPPEIYFIIAVLLIRMVYHAWKTGKCANVRMGKCAN